MDEFIVRGAAIVNPERIFRADVWVKGDKIHYIHEKITGKLGVREIEASSFYLLPGFFHFGSHLGNARTTSKQFLSIQGEWVKRGFTFFVDDLTIGDVCDWRKQLRYEVSMYQNSWLDCQVRLSIPYAMLSEQLIRAVSSLRIPMLEVTISNLETPNRLFWPILLACFRERRTALKLSFSPLFTGQEKKRWLETHLFLLLSTVKYHRIPFVLQEDKETVSWVSAHKQKELSYITWEMDESSSLSNARMQFGTLNSHVKALDTSGSLALFLQKVTDVQSRRPAKLFNVYPQKGAIVPGSDADFLLVSEKKITKDATFWQPEIVYSKGTPINNFVLEEARVRKRQIYPYLL
ncbi:hypothetical protein [Aneurinibacillus tyrosinisolvens]|uniref:hypothetical protein n=1 Tax=Aneurinibacillus tyrosinisolvens TaxID=1443435 RepID=UPI00063F3EC4|nr:hypothetical protein [Aneurinibacillus tyrosinisolvens]